MNYTQGGIISFATMVIYGTKQGWGEQWTLREIDGIFYNQYRNPSLLDAISSERRRFLKTDKPPHPCTWDSSNAEDILIYPFGNGGVSKPELQIWHRPNIPNGGGMSVDFRLSQIAETFCVSSFYLRAAFLHGTPIRFERVTIGGAHEYPPGISLRWTPKFGQVAKRESRS